MEIQAGLVAGKEAADKRHQESQNSLVSHFKAEKEVTEAEYAAAKKQILAHFESETRRIQKEYDSIHEQIIARYEGSLKNLEKQLTEGRWEVMAMSEAARSGSNLQLKEIVDGLDGRWQDLQTIHRTGRGIAPRTRAMARVHRAASGRTIAGNRPCATFYPGS